MLVAFACEARRFHSFGAELKKVLLVTFTLDSFSASLLADPILVSLQCTVGPGAPQADLEL